MDFDAAVNAHNEWKARLAAYLRNPDHTLDPESVASDSGCTLGQWIHGEGRCFEDQPEFQCLRAEHARFHRYAAEIVLWANRGEDVSEEVALGARSLYAIASRNVVDLVLGLKQKAA